jgi:6-phosphogluconolactonase
MSVESFPDAQAAAVGCGMRILEWLREAIAESGSATLAISGGTSPRPMFEMFAGAGFDWSRVDVFWVDERVVPKDDPQSNFKLARETWLGPAGVPEERVHRVRTELGAESAAEAYAEEIRGVMGPAAQFNVIHRGMGADGHTASLFPGSASVGAQGLAIAVYVEKMAQWRVTLTAAVLEAARHTAILATGADKRATLDAVLNGPYEPFKYPAQIASRDGSNAVWFVDRGVTG